jgi:hypothetical protein
MPKSDGSICKQNLRNRRPQDGLSHFRRKRGRALVTADACSRSGCRRYYRRLIEPIQFAAVATEFCLPRPNASHNERSNRWSPSFRVQSHGTGRSLLVVVSAYITKGHAKLLFRSQRYSSSEAERRGRTYDGRAVWLRQFTRQNRRVPARAPRLPSSAALAAAGRWLPGIRTTASATRCARLGTRAHRDVRPLFLC